MTVDKIRTVRLTSIEEGNILKENSLTLHMDSVIPKTTDMQQDGLMMCPHFRDWHTACCVAGEAGEAGEGGIVLLPFMRKEYCRSANFRNCPLGNSQKEQHISRLLKN